MTEEQQPEPTGQDTNTYTQAQMDSKVNNFITQIKDLQSTVATLTSTTEQANTEREQQEADRLAKKEEWKALHEQTTVKLNDTVEAHAVELAKLKAEKNSLVQDYAISKAGITDEIAILGLKSKYATLDDAPEIGAWLETLRSDQPELFDSKAAVGTKNKAAGVVAVTGPQDPEQLRGAMLGNDADAAKAASNSVFDKYNLNRYRK